METYDMTPQEVSFRTSNPGKDYHCAAPPVPPDGMVDTTDLWARFDLMQVSMKATLDESNEAKRLELNVERARLEREDAHRREAQG